MYNTLEIIGKVTGSPREKCPECGGSELTMDSEVVCSQCGLVIFEHILDPKPEWRAFTFEEKQAKDRVGSPSSLSRFDKGLSTTFQPYKDMKGKLLPVKKQLQMIRLRKWHFRARMHSSIERNLYQAMDVLSRFSDKLHVPKYVEENAALIYRKVLEKGFIRGRSIKGSVAASLYAACRLNQTPRSLKRVVKISGRSQKEISRLYRLIQQELKLKIPIDNPFKYVSKIASKMKLSQGTENLGIELLLKAQQIKSVVGKDPSGIAAAALYIASKLNHEKIIQKELAKAAEVTEVTIRNRYKRLMIDLGLTF